MNGEGGIGKIPTGIIGFDEVALGGLPAGRSTLVSGTTGSGKTLFSAQFLAGGIRRYDEPGVFVTFEERPAELRRNLAPLGFDVEGWEASGKWVFVDATSEGYEQDPVVGAYDFGALVLRIDHAVRNDRCQAGGDRLAGGDLQPTRRPGDRAQGDVPGVVEPQGDGPHLGDHGGAQRRVQLDQPLRRRGVRGRQRGHPAQRPPAGEASAHRRDPEVPRRSSPKRGVLLHDRPRRGAHRDPGLDDGRGPETGEVRRISMGTAELDRLCGGGLFANSTYFVSGPTGTGKTLMATHFVAAGATAGERSLLYSFEESRQQLFRNAVGWGFDPVRLEQTGNLRILFDYPEVASLEDHFIVLRQAIDEFQPQRMVIDSVGALEQVATPRGLRDFLLGLAAYLRQRGITAVFTATTGLFGGGSPTEANLSSLADGIILLRYVELVGEVRRAINVLKMRGSAHDQQIREYTIDGQGLHIGRPYSNVTGILTGQAHPVPSGVRAEGAILVLEDEERAERGPT